MDEHTIGQLESNSRRIDRLERDLSTLTEKVISLGEIATQTNSNIEHLIEQVGVVSTRTYPKPTNWSVVIAGLSLLAVVATLAFKPLYDEAQEQKQFDIEVMHHLLKDAREAGHTEADLYWLEKLEERTNNRLHGE